MFFYKNYLFVRQVTSLSKDMEKLKVGEGSPAPPGEKMSESRKKELRRLSSKRRSSKQSKITDWISVIISGELSSESYGGLN